MTTLRDIKLTVRALLRDKEAKKALNRKAGAKKAAVTRRQNRSSKVEPPIVERTTVSGRDESLSDPRD